MSDPADLAAKVESGDLRFHELEEHADADTAPESIDPGVDRPSRPRTHVGSIAGSCLS